MGNFVVILLARETNQSLKRCDFAGQGNKPKP